MFGILPLDLGDDFIETGKPNPRHLSFERHLREEQHQRRFIRAAFRKFP
jgi:hypothetical protein